MLMGGVGVGLLYRECNIHTCFHGKVGDCKVGARTLLFTGAEWVHGHRGGSEGPEGRRTGRGQPQTMGLAHPMALVCLADVWTYLAGLSPKWLQTAILRSQTLSLLQPLETLKWLLYVAFTLSVRTPEKASHTSLYFYLVSHWPGAFMLPAKPWPLNTQMASEGGLGDSSWNERGD